MTMKTIELASLAATQELVIPEGMIATYDAAQGALVVASIVNHGTLRILSASDNQEAVIAARTILNTGTIDSELPTLRLHVSKINAAKKGGAFSAPQLLHIESDADLQINGGIFAANVLQLTSAGKVGVNAYRLDAKVKVKAKEVAVGAADGNLEIIEQEIDGDPLYYQGKDTNGGNMTITVMNQPGEDVSLFAVGNITVSGPINTLGGDDQHPGHITIVGGCQKVAYNGLENDGRLDCVDCSLPFAGLEVIPPNQATNASVVTTGNLSGKGITVQGGTLNIGDVFGDNENVAPNGVSFLATDSATIGNVTVVNRVQGNVFKGGVTVGAGKNITVGNVDGGVLLQTSQSGQIKVGNVDSDIGSIQIFAGGDFSTGGGGGGAAIASAQQLQPVPDASIQAGNLRSRSIIRLMANGAIGSGTVTLDDGNFFGAGQTHDIRIHANINKTGTVPVFRAGGGTSNGTGAITNNGLVFRQADQAKMGAVAITNGPGNIDIFGSNVRCLPNQYGVPGLAVDAPGTESDTNSGQIRVLGTLSTNGNSSVPAGFIVLMGKQLRANGAVITASDTMTTPEEKTPEIIVAVDRIELPGGLNMMCDGNMRTSVRLVPSGSEQLDIIQWPGGPFPIDPNPVQPTQRELAIAGSGNLQVTANSHLGEVYCSGNALKVTSSGTTLFKSQGEDSKVTVTYAGAPSGQNSLVLLAGPLTLSVDNADGKKGSILLQADKVRNEAIATLRANSLADGDGGTITVEIDRGNLTLGTAQGSFAMTAMCTGNGNGGTITIENAKHNGSITLEPTFSPAAINVNAMGANGKGGVIKVNADRLLSSASGDNGFVANGAGIERGGIIELKTTEDITIGNNPGLALTAKSTGSGNGGDIDVLSRKGSITVDGSKISVEAGTDGQGGTVTIKTLGTDSNLQVSGVLMANGDGSGRGGIITLNAANALALNSAKLEAKGGATARGGRVILRSGADLTLNGEDISVTPGDQGANRGGMIDVSCSGKLTATGKFNANGHGNGAAGEITLRSNSAQGLTLTGSTTALTARGKTGNLNEPNISILNDGGDVTIEQSAEVNVSSLNPTGDAGSIVIRAGSAGQEGALKVISAAKVQADGGSSGGNAGKISLTYFSGGGRFVTIQSAIVTADRPSTGAVGSITTQNLSSSSPLEMRVEAEGKVSALNGVLNFDQAGQDVRIRATNTAQDPYTGRIVSTGKTLVTNVQAPFTYDLVFGDVTFDESVDITLEGGGEMNSALMTRIKSPELRLQANGGDVGLTRDLNTAVRTLKSGTVPTFNTVNVRNTLDAGEDLKVEGEWFVSTAFFVITSGDLEIGQIVKNTTAQGGITAIALDGSTLTVRPNSIISAQEASILLQGGTVAQPGRVTLGTSVELDASTTTDNLALGSVTVLCGAASAPVEYFDNDIEHVRLVQPETSFIGGPNGLTANEPDNKVDVRNRGVVLYGPLAESITLNGSVFVRAQGEVE